VTVADEAARIIREACCRSLAQDVSLENQVYELLRASIKLALLRQEPLDQWLLAKTWLEFGLRINPDVISKQLH